MNSLPNTQWTLPGPSSYRIAWWYDEAAKDERRRLAPLATASLVDSWGMTHRLLLREIGEALGGPMPGELLIGGRGRGESIGQLKTRIAAAFRAGTLVLLKPRPVARNLHAWQELFRRLHAESIPLRMRSNCCSNSSKHSPGQRAPSLKGPSANTPSLPSMRNGGADPSALPRTISADYRMYLGNPGETQWQMLAAASTSSGAASRPLDGNAHQQDDPLKKPLWGEMFYSSPSVIWPGSFNAEDCQDVADSLRGKLDQLIAQGAITSATVPGEEGLDINVRNGARYLLSWYAQMLQRNPHVKSDWAKDVVIQYKLEIQMVQGDTSAAKQKKKSKGTLNGGGNTQPNPAGTYLARLSIGPSGHAQVQVLGKLAPPLAPTRTRAETIAILSSTYGLTVVEGGQQVWVKDDLSMSSKAWTDDELNDVVGALSLIPVEDRDALRGLLLVRVEQLPSSAAGEAAGRFRMDIQHTSSLIYDDDVFNKMANVYGSTTAFYPLSFHSILHEVGHAVAAQDALKAEIVLQKALTDRQALNDEWTREGGVRDQYKKAVNTYNKTKVKSQSFNQLKSQYESLRDSWAAANARVSELAVTRNGAYVEGVLERVHRLVQLVNASQEEVIPFTKYAKDSWPDKPGEFFADAYSLCLTQPDFVGQYYGKVHNFFVTGKYR